MIHTCAVCDGYTYDADPIRLATQDGQTVRLWLCSPECAWEAGGRSAASCMSGELPTLAKLRELFKAEGLEVLS